LIFFLFFSLNKTSKKMVDTNPMMIQVGQGPLADCEGVMKEVNEISEEVMPKPQITRPSRLVRKRKITFVVPISANTPRVDTVNPKVGEGTEHDDLDDQVEHPNKANNIRFEIANIELSRKLSKLQNTVKCVMTRMKQEKLQHEQIRAILVAKGQEYEEELDQQLIKLKVSQEAEAESRHKYSTMRSNFFSVGNDNKIANLAVAELTDCNTKLEREAKLMEAKISGQESRGRGRESPSKNEVQLAEELHLLEIL
jgi:hypothetical protein